VGHAAGELTDGFQFLRLAHGVLGLTPASCHRQVGRHAREQLACRKGLRVVAGAGIEPLDPCLLACPGR